ncbi:MULTISPECIES: ABC transporter [unclassified Streptomyces]|uniref:ABC transporter n=1 Tax=unclassified Streptomyces TaxID=2593676 RepID=UPI0036E84178
MTALLRYQTALLIRSQRWLAPVLLYAALVGVGVQSGQPVLDSLGYAAAGLLPVTAWLVQLCAHQDPPAARTVTAAVAGAPRVHLASLLSALGCAGLLGAVATLIVLLISKPTSTDGSVRVPLLHRRGWSLAATVIAALLALVTSGSPANRAVTGLVTGSRSGTVHLPLLPLLAAAVLAAAVTGLACRLTSLRG